MTLHSRILDMLPALLVFAIVTAFATYVLVEYVAHEPIRASTPQQQRADQLPRPAVPQQRRAR